MWVAGSVGLGAQPGPLWMGLGLRWAGGVTTHPQVCVPGSAAAVSLKSWLCGEWQCGLRGAHDAGMQVARPDVRKQADGDVGWVCDCALATQTWPGRS